MTGVLDFLTSKVGLFAGVLAILALAATVQTLIRPWLLDRRESRRSVARLDIADVSLGDLSKSSSSRDLRFCLTNGGNRGAVLVDLIVSVSASRSSHKELFTETEAEVPRRIHRVDLRPGARDYDIRARRFGPEPGLLTFAPGETEPFLVRLTSVDAECYELRVVASWFDTGESSVSRRAETVTLTADFPPRSHRVY